MRVGIRDLKSKLSEYLEKVERGETIIVTNHGRGVAMIIAMPGRNAIERGLREGWAFRKEDRPPSDVVPAMPRPGTPTTTEIIRRDRDS